MNIGAQTNVKVLSDRLRVVDFTIAGMTAERLALLARIREARNQTAEARQGRG